MNLKCNNRYRSSTWINCYGPLLMHLSSSHNLQSLPQIRGIRARFFVVSWLDRPFISHARIRSSVPSWYKRTHKDHNKPNCSMGHSPHYKDYPIVSIMQYILHTIWSKSFVEVAIMLYWLKLSALYGKTFIWTKGLISLNLWAPNSALYCFGFKILLSSQYRPNRRESLCQHPHRWLFLNPLCLY